MPRKKVPRLKIEFKEVGTLSRDEKEYFAQIGKCIIEFSKAEHNLDEAIIAALNQNRRHVTSLSKHFPSTMSDKLELMVHFCESEVALSKFVSHLQNRIKELGRAMDLRNTLCHGYLDLIKTQHGETEFRFTRWRRSQEKYKIRQISTFPKRSSVKKAIRAMHIWKVLFAELEIAIKSLPKRST